MNEIDQIGRMCRNLGAIRTNAEWIEKLAARMDDKLLQQEILNTCKRIVELTQPVKRHTPKWLDEALNEGTGGYVP